MRYFYFFAFLFLFIFGLPLASYGQEIQQTKAGDYIVVMPDGSWETYNPKNATHKKLKKDFEQKKTAVAEQAKKAPKTTTPKQPAAKPTTKKLMLTEAEISKHIKTLEEEKAKGIFADNMYLQRLEYDDKLASYKKQPNLKKNDPELERLGNFLAEAKSNEKSAKKAFEKASKNANNARAILEKAQIDTKKYPTYVLRATIIEKSIATAQPKDDAKKVTTAKENTSKQPKDKNTNNKTATAKVKTQKVVKETKKDTIKITKAKNEKTVKITETAPITLPITNEDDCNIVFEGIDEFTKRKKRETRAQTLFHYTDDGMKAYYEDKDFLTCDVNISAVEGTYKYVIFTFTFASENVVNAYGWLEKDNLLMLKFIDGTTLNLYNSRTDRGQVNIGDHTTMYKAICIIGAGEEKMLQKKELDAIRIMWSTGTEDYDIYDVDFFANQLKCLSK